MFNHTLRGFYITYFSLVAFAFISLIWYKLDRLSWFRQRESFLICTENSTGPWMFSRFLNCANGTKPRKASHLKYLETLLPIDLKNYLCLDSNVSLQVTTCGTPSTLPLFANFINSPPLLLIDHLILVCVSWIFKSYPDTFVWELALKYSAESKTYPASIYLLKFNIVNTKTICKIRSTPERRQWRLCVVFIVGFEKISDCSIIPVVYFEQVNGIMCTTYSKPKCTKVILFAKYRWNEHVVRI